MKNIEELLDTVKNLQDELVTYLDQPNKAKSKRIRKILGQIKNQTPTFRARLVELDKAGY